jgi:hypothetical protein
MAEAEYHAPSYLYSYIRDTTLETSGRRIIGGTKIMRGLITSNVRVNTAMEPPNNAMNLPVRPVTRLAGLLLIWDSTGREQGARPSRPAGYRGRYAD